MYGLFSAEVMLETSVLTCRVARGPQPWGFDTHCRKKPKKQPKKSPKRGGFPRLALSFWVRYELLAEMKTGRRLELLCEVREEAGTKAKAN